MEDQWRDKILKDFVESPYNDLETYLNDHGAHWRSEGVSRTTYSKMYGTADLIYKTYKDVVASLRSRYLIIEDTNYIFTNKINDKMHSDMKEGFISVIDLEKKEQLGYASGLVRHEIYTTEDWGK